MKSINFKGYTFYYPSEHAHYFINDRSLTFFRSATKVQIHISMVNGQLLLRPRYGVTIQKLAPKTYQIISN